MTPDERRVLGLAKQFQEDRKSQEAISAFATCHAYAPACSICQRLFGSYACNLDYESVLVRIHELLHEQEDLP